MQTNTRVKWFIEKADLLAKEKSEGEYVGKQNNRTSS